MIKAVLFDLDGTLLNTIDDLADSANYALSQRGYPSHDTEAYKYFVGNGMAKLLERVLPGEKRSQEEIAALRDIYASYYESHAFDKTRPYEGIPELLDELRKRGLRLGGVSNKPDDQTQLTVSRMFNSDAFDFVTGNRPEFPLKPNPDVVFHVLRALHTLPGECMFMGDTGIDMQTAKRSGCTAVGVTWGFRKKEELDENGADYVIDAPSELLNLLPAKS